MHVCVESNLCNDPVARGSHTQVKSLVPVTWGPHFRTLSSEKPSMSPFLQTPNQRILGLGRVEGGGSLGPVWSVCLQGLEGKEVPKHFSCWAGASHSLHAKSTLGNARLRDGMSLIWSRGRPLLVTRPSDMFSSRKEMQTQMGTTNCQGQNSASVAPCHGPTGRHWLLPGVRYNHMSSHYWKASCPRHVHSLCKHLVGFRHSLPAAGNPRKYCIYRSHRVSNPFWDKKQ